MSYRFRREDDGTIVEVDFETQMSQDRAGYITLDDGVKARRVNDFVSEKAKVEPQNANQTPPVSDNLGFMDYQLDEFEAHRVSKGHVGVEFKPDPQFPHFMQVHFASHAARDKYLADRGKVDLNKSSGAALSKEALLGAAEMVKNHWESE